MADGDDPKALTLAEVRTDYYAATATTSELSRKLALTGIAVVWVLKTKFADKMTEELLLPSAFFVFALALDLLQYAWRSGSLGMYHWWKDEVSRLKPSTVIDFPPRLNLPGLLFFWAKCVAVLAGYFYLLDPMVRGLRQ